MHCQRICYLHAGHKDEKLNKGSLKNIILTDTVGFISELPTELIMSFRSTLEEINYADLIINVRDISSGIQRYKTLM